PSLAAADGLTNSFGSIIGGARASKVAPSIELFERVRLRDEAAPRAKEKPRKDTDSHGHRQRARQVGAGAVQREKDQPDPEGNGQGRGDKGAFDDRPYQPALRSDLFGEIDVRRLRLRRWLTFHRHERLRAVPTASRRVVSSYASGSAKGLDSIVVPLNGSASAG